MKQNNRSFSAVRFAVFLTLSVTVMAVIFVFSAQNGEQSSAASGFVSDFLRRVLSPVMPDEALDFVLKYIRKIAHISIYFLLGLFAALSASELSRKTGRLWLCIFAAWTVCMLYAVSDEFHQSFTAGREASFRDVLIDSAGALISVSLIGIISFIKRKRVTKAWT